MHISVHVYVSHLEALVLEHALNGDDVWMDLTPAERFDGRVDDVGTIVTHLKNGSHGKPRPRVSVILYDDVRMLRLNHTRQLAEHGRLSYSRHVLETDLGSTGSDELVGYLAIVFGCMYWRVGYAERGLRCHSRLGGPFDAWYDIAHVIESAEDTWNIDTLSVLHLIHQLADVVRHGIHA